MSQPPAGEQTLYWYDLETFGLDPARDRVAQFAGVRTDLALNVLGSPQVFYCKPPPDYLPDPYSCLVTGITPQMAFREGFIEAEFIARIRAEFLHPLTCVVGYNNIRFDDEVLRYTLYRNLYDPYEREWRFGNSRWDIIDMVRLVGALRPEGIHWPETDEGRTGFRLEQLTAANDIAHTGAHDALADVYATIALARLIKTRQPRLYDYVFTHRGKVPAAALLRLGSFEPVVHVSGRYSGERRHLAVVVALAQHPSNANGVIVYDLSVDPTPLITLDADEIRRRVFTATAQSIEVRPRIPLKTVHLNKCPVLAPLKVIRPEDEARLILDRARLDEHLDQLRAAAPGLGRKVAAVFDLPAPHDDTDPEVRLYDGGFFEESDRRQLIRLHQGLPSELATKSLEFRDRRLPEMLFRFRARNYPETLTPEEHGRWESFRLGRLMGAEGGRTRTLGDYHDAIERYATVFAQDERIQLLLSDLRKYGRTLRERNSSILAYTEPVFSVNREES